jgi:diacylglycerol O-acyltransferase / wax synthase
MSERLSPQDVARLSAESRTTPMHVGTLEIFQLPPGGFEYERLVGLIADRLSYVPRYRQRVRTVPGRLANPVWLDDEDFDLTFHVRRSALPRPGSMDQLRALVARIMSRRLDRNRPLWETYLVAGLEHDRFAVLSKTHQVLVDGSNTVDLGQLILDVTPQPPETPTVPWSPRHAPSSAGIVVRAATDSLRRPATAVEAASAGVANVRHVASRVRGVVDEVWSAFGAPRSTSSTPLTTPLSEQRRFVTVATALDDYRRVRNAHGGSINDVVLASVTGGLRDWLLTRGEPVRSSTRIQTLVPMSVTNDDGEPTSLGSQVQAQLVDLPVGESNAVVRLHQVSYALQTHRETGRAISARRLTGLAGFAPSTFHVLGARVAGGHSGRSYDLVVTNVPGPQFPLYAAGARMLASYPVVPLGAGQALAIGVTSYDGEVFYGLNADRDAMPDVAVVADCVSSALSELVETTSEERTRAPLGRDRVTGKSTSASPARTPKS